MKSIIQPETPKMKMILVIAMVSGAFASLTANADDYLDPATGITWHYTDKNDDAKTVTLGMGSTGQNPDDAGRAMPKATVLDAANIPWSLDINNDGNPYKVTKISAGAFNGCANLTGTLTIPSTVTSIGIRAFVNCTGLTRLESLGGVTSIGNYAFNGCNNMTGEDLTGVGSFGVSVFSGCSQLTKVMLNSTLTSISDNLFNSTGITSVEIPRSVTSVKKGAFGYTQLVGLLLPEPYSGTTSIAADSLCRGCASLKTVLFGKNTDYDGTGISSYAMLAGASNCKWFFAPVGSGWTSEIVGGNPKMFLYGPGQDLDIDIDYDAKTITATPATAEAFTNVLNAAASFKTGFDYSTKICMTNAIEVAEGTVTDALMAGVQFESLVFFVKSQAQLDMVMNATRDITVPLCIDPTGAKQQMTVPADRRVWVLLSGDGKYTPKINGLVITIH